MNGVWVSGSWILVSALVMAMALTGWRLSWMATRLDRAHSRAERTWAALDAALVRRANRAQEVAADPRVAPATALTLATAASAALAPDLDPDERERRESSLSAALSGCPRDQDQLEHQRVVLARRLHNDAVTTAIGLRRRRTVSWFKLAGHAAEPRAFEIADFTRPTPTCTELSPEPTKVTAVSGDPHASR